MIKNIKWKTLIVCILIPLAVGGLAAFLLRSDIQDFENKTQPFLSPPTWLFPIVWTILYILMGIASYFVVVSETPDDDKHAALILYGAQLVVNFLWSFIFFSLELYLFAFLWLLLLLGLIFAVQMLFRSISKIAGYLFLPYLVWVAFAGYLNLAVYILN